MLKAMTYCFIELDVTRVCRLLDTGTDHGTLCSRSYLYPGGPLCTRVAQGWLLAI